MTESCQCTASGYCTAHQREKTAAEVALCRTSAHYRALWDRQALDGTRDVCSDWEKLEGRFRCRRCRRDYKDDNGSPPSGRPCVPTKPSAPIQPVLCAEWEELGNAIFRCKRCNKPYSAVSIDRLPTNRACIVAGEPTRPPAPAGCSTCGAPKPTLVEKVKSAAKAAVDFVASGFDTTKDDELSQRQSACGLCKFRSEDGKHCLVCGCILALKQRERAAHCPAGLWPDNEYPWLPSTNDHWLKQVTVVIPSYGASETTAQVVRDCLREPVHVIVIDNKGDYKTVGRETVHVNTTNIGWGASCHWAMDRFLKDERSKYLVLLNNDVRLSQRFFCGLLVAQSITESGIVSACYNTGYLPQRNSAGYIGSADDYRPKPLHRNIDQVDGTCVLITKECLEKTGAFDLSVSPEYGWGLMADLCIRANQAGFSRSVTEASYCEHVQGGMQTAKLRYGSEKMYQVAAKRESGEGLSKKWGSKWSSLLTKPNGVGLNGVDRDATWNGLSSRAVPSRAIKTLNLIYHIWPVATNNRWRWNVEQLLKRIEIFNGKKVVAIATGERSSPTEEVKAMFSGHDVTFIEKPNSAVYREANTFLELLASVKTDDPSQATFYAHCKGVSRPENEAEVHWASLMYRELLDDPDRVRRALSEKGMLGVSFEFETPWIYPGTFWWFHNASLFAKANWNTLENPVTGEGVGWSVEAFPNRFFSDDCERIYPNLIYPTRRAVLCYNNQFWEQQTNRATGKTDEREQDILAKCVKEFDETLYLRRYPDVARDVKNKTWASGLQHFVSFGFWEGRIHQ